MLAYRRPAVAHCNSLGVRCISASTALVSRCHFDLVPTFLSKSPTVLSNSFQRFYSFRIQFVILIWSLSVAHLLRYASRHCHIHCPAHRAPLCRAFTSSVYIERSDRESLNRALGTLRNALRLQLWLLNCSTSKSVMANFRLLNWAV